MPNNKVTTQTQTVTLKQQHINNKKRKQAILEIQSEIKCRTYLDLETYSKEDLKKVGAHRYAEDCEILMCAVKQTHTSAEIIKHPPTNTLLSVYNAGFESSILNDPSLTYRDVQHKVAWHGLPLSLDKAGKVLGLSQDLAKMKDGKRLIAKFCKPVPIKKSIAKKRTAPKLGLFPAPEYHRLSKHNPISRYTKENALEDWIAFKQYCKQDVVATQAIDEILPDLSTSEQQLADLDLKINHVGIPVDIPLIKRIIKLIDKYINSEIKKCQRLTGFSPSQVKKLKDWCAIHGCILPNLNADTIKLTLDDPTVSNKVKSVLQIRLNTSNSSLKKYPKMLDTVSKDGRIRGTMQFYAANTGRWGGRGMQPQNLPRGKFDAAKAISSIKLGASITELTEQFSSPPELFKSCIRGMIYHPDGFTVVDYAGIEARVVQWLVDDQKALQIFRDKKDVYKHMASLIYSIPYKKITKEKRFLGKQAILGLSYQMGIERLIDTCASYGKPVTKQLAEHTVSTYRKTHSKLIEYWKEIETAAIKSVRTEKVTTAGRIKFKLKGDFLHMRLPSGRTIIYPFPKVEITETDWGKRKQQLTYLASGGKRTSTYGGKLVENVTQGIARDILADALKRLDKEGYKIIFHVHDEVIIEGTYPPEDISEIMCDIESWADGNVIDAEGFNCTRYKKD